LNADAEHLKSQGNSYFQSLDYQNAAECYTRCLAKIAINNNENDLDMKKIVLSNRSQSYLKLKRYLEAEYDAD
jgi:tetratricopeptide (TPR) repeat protein